MTPFPDMILEPLVRAALLEDLGTYGDLTTRTVIAPGTRYAARIVAREAGVDRREQPRDIVMVERSGQRPRRARPR